MNGYEVRTIIDIRNVIFGFQLWKLSSAVRPKLGCLPS